MRDAPREKDLLDELARRRQQITEATDRFHADRDPLNRDRLAILSALALLYHGIEMGCLVLCHGKRYQVTQVNVDFCWGDGDELWLKENKPWATGKVIKKDGSLGAREFNLYSDWEVPK